jgi:hypothetical protein
VKKTIKKPSRQKLINGILCDFKFDEHGFVNVFIADTNPPQKLLPEWIVRGVVDLETAIALAKGVIEVRLEGGDIFHDAEGQIEYSPAGDTRKLRLENKEYSDLIYYTIRFRQGYEEGANAALEIHFGIIQDVKEYNPWLAPPRESQQTADQGYWTAFDLSYCSNLKALNVKFKRLKGAHSYP